MYNIRVAKEEDWFSIVTMAYNFFLTTPMQKEKVSIQKITNMVDTFIKGRKEEFIILVLTHNDIPVGMIAGRVVESLITEGYTAYEQMWYVEPEHRGRNGLKLFLLFEEWAKRVGANMVVMANFQDTGIDKIYKRNGYTPVENSYFKILREQT